ncbi:MAG: thioredoxin family protein [Phycisphaerales bacterium JB050]
MDDTTPTAPKNTETPLPDHGTSRATSVLKTLLYGLLIVGLLSGVMFMRTRPAPTPEVFRQDLSVTDAIDLASESDRPLLAVITADWCAPCQSYKRGALASEEVQTWIAENTIAVMFNADTMSRSDAMLLNFAGSIPATAMVIDGRVVGQFEGTTNSGALMNWMKASTDG